MTSPTRPSPRTPPHLTPMMTPVTAAAASTSSRSPAVEAGSPPPPACPCPHVSQPHISRLLNRCRGTWKDAPSAHQIHCRRHHSSPRWSPAPPAPNKTRPPYMPRMHTHITPITPPMPHAPTCTPAPAQEMWLKGCCAALVCSGESRLCPFRSQQCMAAKESPLGVAPAFSAGDEDDDDATDGAGSGAAGSAGGAAGGGGGGSDVADGRGMGDGDGKWYYLHGKGGLYDSR